MKLVYLLYSRLKWMIVIPKLDINLAKFFTLLYDEHYLNCERIERHVAYEHKIIHAFGKMNTINPTSELVNTKLYL